MPRRGHGSAAEGERPPLANDGVRASGPTPSTMGVRVVLELDLKLTAVQVLDECRRRGIVIRSERELAGQRGSHHWHLGIPGRPGTLELNERQNRVWVKVHPRRDGGWATPFAHELSAQRVD